MAVLDEILGNIKGHDAQIYQLTSRYVAKRPTLSEIATLSPPHAESLKPGNAYAVIINSENGLSDAVRQMIACERVPMIRYDGDEVPIWYLTVMNGEIRVPGYSFSYEQFLGLSRNMTYTHPKEALSTCP